VVSDVVRKRLLGLAPAERAPASAYGKQTSVARLFYVECRAPSDVLERRLLAREHEHDRVSDATVGVLRRQLADREPLDEVGGAAHALVRSDQRVDDVIAAVEDALDRVIARDPRP
jgi:predicted kinase